MIVLADDLIIEGTEAFRLRIVAARFFGEAATIFRAPAGLTNTVAEVFIADDDCKFMNTTCVICLQTVTRRTYLYARHMLPVLHALSPPTVIAVSWIISEPIQVREGEGVRLELFAQAFGLYATPIEIGVVCAEVNATDVPPGADTISNIDTLEHAINFTCLFTAFPDSDFEVLSGSTLEFTDVETLRSNSSNNLTLLITDNEIAEPYESFICTLQGDSVDHVHGVEPNRITVWICDDDGEHKPICTVHIV